MFFWRPDEVLQPAWSSRGHAGRLFLEGKPFQGITFPLRRLENRYKAKAELSGDAGF
jgi:hypothetical protein